MKEYKIFLKQYLSKDRFKHSVSTAKFMKKYSKFFNVDKEKSYLAGLLHDVSKELSNLKILELAIKFKHRNIIKIEYFDFKKIYPFLLHGIASAEIIFSELNIDDPEILEAVSCHTTGGKNITKLSKFTFMADYCEPLRENYFSKKIYNILIKEKNFSKAYFYTYVYLIDHIIKKENPICPESIDGYNEALNNYRN